MALSMQRKASLFLFSVVLGVARAQVPSPTNLSLDCQNFINILRWDYLQHASLKPSFRVSITALSGRPEPLQVDYPNLQCDLSAFRSSDNDYNVTVTALVGLNESLAAPQHGLTFSYFYSSMSEQKCTLDLPPINVTFQPEAGIKFSFSHPSVLYGQKLLAKPKRRQKKPNDRPARKVSEFSFSAVVNGDKEYHGSCMRDVCEKVIPAGLQHDCVRIEGYWENIVVQSTQDYCAQATATAATAAGYQTLYIGLGVFFIIALLVLMFAFFCKRITTSSQIPYSLSFPQRNNPNGQQDLSHHPLIPNPPSLSPSSPSSCSPTDPLTGLTGGQNGVGSGLSTITAAEKEPRQPGVANGSVANGGVAHGSVANGSVPRAPRVDPAAEASGMDPARNDPGGTARDAGQGDPGMQPQVGEEPGVAAGAPGPLPPDAEEEELEQLGVGDPNAAGYEQRVRVELIPGDLVDAYHG